MCVHKQAAASNIRLAHEHFQKAHNATAGKKPKSKKVLSHLENGYQALNSANSSASQIEYNGFPGLQSVVSTASTLKKSVTPENVVEMSGSIRDLCNGVAKFCKKN